MGDYSTVRLEVDHRYVDRILSWCKVEAFTPDAIFESPRHPTGAHKSRTVLVWDEVKSGTENPDMQLIFDNLLTLLIPYRCVDEGCWGVWSEVEILHENGKLVQRPLVDNETVLRKHTWRKATEGLSLEEKGHLIDAYFSDDPEGWW